MSNAFNPIAPQGILNRVLTHVVVTDFPFLNVNAGFMAKSQATMTFEGDFVEQLGSATGIVTSAVPYVMGSIEFGLLRSQALADLWLQQVIATATIGTVTLYSDSTTLSRMTITNGSVQSVVPGPMDGSDPTFRVTVKGSFYINNNMWLGITTV
jgi:hypothetical protein